jgi:hypothetical protein
MDEGEFELSVSANKDEGPLDERKGSWRPAPPPDRHCAANSAGAGRARAPSKRAAGETAGAGISDADATFDQ